MIRGGVATNIVAKECVFHAEARSHDEKKLIDLVEEMLEFDLVRGGGRRLPRRRGRPQVVPRLPLQAGRSGRRPGCRGLAACRTPATLGLSGGAADANVFNEHGIQCVNLANGMADIHTPDERIAVADLEAMVDVTLALVDAALA